MSNTPDTTRQTVEEILDEHARYYIIKTIDYLENNPGGDPKTVTQHNEQDDKSLAAIELHYKGKMLEVIGEDADVSQHVFANVPCKECGEVQPDVTKNRLRAAQRQRLALLGSKGEDNGKRKTSN